MLVESLPPTCATLLFRLGQNPSDHAGWDEFVDRYGPHIYRWCRRWNLQDADAEDVTQNILVKLARNIRHFTYNPDLTFRGWLKTVAHHAWRDFEASRRRLPAKAQDKEMLTLEAREDLVHKLENAFDLEMLDLAKERVRRRVASHTWEAFCLTALEGLPVAEVAPRVGMQVAMVYVAKSKVQRMLQEEIARLEAQEPVAGRESLAGSR